MPSTHLERDVFYILKALSERPRRGSGIHRSVLEQTGGKLHIWPATLFGVLGDLVDCGWVVGDGRRYSITLAGIRTLPPTSVGPEEALR